MYIKNFRILNYKSYEDSGIHPLQRGFNVLVGQNNSGKTALVEALSLKFQPAPHRSLRRRMGAPVNPASRTDVTFVFSGAEARDILLAGGGFQFPIRPDWRGQVANMLDDLLSRPEIELAFKFVPTGGVPATVYPS